MVCWNVATVFHHVNKIMVENKEAVQEWLFRLSWIILDGSFLEMYAINSAGTCWFVSIWTNQQKGYYHTDVTKQMIAFCFYLRSMCRKKGGHKKEKSV